VNICPEGMVFLQPVDATYSSKTGEYRFRLFASVVHFVSTEDVVHFVSQNASDMRSPWKVKGLEEELHSL